jgi:acetyl esterase/lipase
MIWRSLVVLLLVGATLPAAEGKTYEVETKKDIPYCEGDSADPVRHKLDLYLPRGCSDYPVLFFIHGGAWTMGNKNEFGIYAGLGKALASQGIGMVSINYRLSPKVSHPGHIEDVAAAFAWVHANLGKHGADRQKIFVCGHSAGGHLCALLSTDESHLKKHGLSLKSIRGAIPISGVFFIPPWIPKTVFGTDPEKRKEAAPAEHVKPGLPPFLILYADGDLRGCDKAPAENFCKLLRDKEVSAETREFKESNHLLIILHACNAEKPVFATIRDFVLKHSK